MDDEEVRDKGTGAVILEGAGDVRRDELELMRWAEVVWPGDKTTAMRRAVEVEREGR